MGKIKVTFRKGDIVRHRSANRKYLIVGTPDKYKIEATNEPAYAYQQCKAPYTIWVRAAVVMEDGRFELTYRRAHGAHVVTDEEMQRREVEGMIVCEECSHRMEYNPEVEAAPFNCPICGHDWALQNARRRRRMKR